MGDKNCNYVSIILSISRLVKYVFRTAIQVIKNSNLSFLIKRNQILDVITIGVILSNLFVDGSIFGDKNSNYVSVIVIGLMSCKICV